MTPGPGWSQKPHHLSGSTQPARQINDLCLGVGKGLPLNFGGKIKSVGTHGCIKIISGERGPELTGHQVKDANPSLGPHKVKDTFPCDGMAH